MKPLHRSLPLILILLGMAGSADAAGPDPTSIPAPGTIAPAFGLHTLLGKRTKGDDERPVLELDGFCGMRPEATRAVVVAFVDVGSDADLAVLNGWYKKHHKAGLEILAVSEAEDGEAFASSLERAGLKFPLLDDRMGIVASRYGVPNSPFSFLMDASCRVLGFSNRSVVADQATLGASIEAQLKGQLGTMDPE